MGTNAIQVDEQGNKYLVLEINKTNTALISTNSKSCYIYGIGKRDYTIHRDSNEVKDMYINKNKFYIDSSPKSFHNYHVFQSRIQNIINQIKLRESFKLNNNDIVIKRVYIGIPNVTELYIDKHTPFSISSIGTKFTEVNERLKYVIEVE